MSFNYLYEVLLFNFKPFPPPWRDLRYLIMTVSRIDFMIQNVISHIPIFFELRSWPEVFIDPFLPLIGRKPTISLVYFGAGVFLIN